MNNMDNSWIPSGVDPETAFRIEVKIEGFLNKQNDGRKVYVKGKLLKWVVDSDRFSLCELNSNLSDEISWGDCQKQKIWMFDKNEGRHVEALSESQILDMFMMYQNERKISLVVVVCDLEGSSNCDINPTYPSTLSQPTPIVAPVTYSQVSSSQGCNSSGQSNQFDNPDEYVGFDDEDMYDFDKEEDVVHESLNYIVQEVNIDPEEDIVHEEPIIDDEVECEPTIVCDPENPNIEVNALFSDVHAFRKALRHFAIKNQFEVSIVKSDKTRFIGKCKCDNCPWRIRASRLQDNKTFKVKKLPHKHTCPSTGMIPSSMASQSWVSYKVGDWLRRNPTAGAKEVKNKLEEDFRVKVTYNKAWSGRRVALDQIYGSWENSFQLLYNFKAELEKRCPGTIVEIDCRKVGNKVHFSKVFVALKPCIDGFVHGCRPYLGVDSTYLTGEYKGQLAAAASIDGHSWLYPVAYGVFDSETTENWTWFMTHLRRAIGCLPGLAISLDASKGIAAVVVSIFPDAEHRECMRHLMDNFNKRFHGDVFKTNMWPAALAYTIEKCQYHLSEINKASPQAIQFLEKNHKQLWHRSKFTEMCKCEYVNNNISESFNSWIKDFKDLHVVDLLDQIRQKIMVTFDKRRMVGNKFKGVIIPSVMKQLNAKSRNIGKVSISRGGDKCAEVSGIDSEGRSWRHVVELDKQECTCREWQISGQPCIHALAFICSLRGAHIEDYVHEYYSFYRFRVAYAGVIKPITDKSHWVNCDPGFKVYPPKMKRPAGRPRKQRVRGCLELSSKKQKCKRCKQLGHQQRTCKEAPDSPNPRPSTSKRKREIKKT